MAGSVVGRDAASYSLALRLALCAAVAVFTAATWVLVVNWGTSLAFLDALLGAPERTPDPHALVLGRTWQWILMSAAVFLMAAVLIRSRFAPGLAIAWWAALLVLFVLGLTVFGVYGMSFVALGPITLAASVPAYLVFRGRVRPNQRLQRRAGPAGYTPGGLT